MFKNFSTYSLLSSPTKAKFIAKNANRLEYGFAGLCDNATLAGIPAFIKACKDEKVKPILGINFNINESSTLTCFAKNINGWKKLVKLTSLSNSKDRFTSKPIIKAEDFSSGEKDLIVMTGHNDGEVIEAIFEDYRLALFAKTYEEAKALVKKDWKKNVVSLFDKYKNIFGDNFYVSVENNDPNIFAHDILNKINVFCAKEAKVRCLANSSSFYPTKNDAPDQRVLLSSRTKFPLSSIESRIETTDDYRLAKFLKSNCYYIHSKSEFLENNNAEQLENMLELAKEVESYDIFNTPQIPKFDCGNITQEEFLTEQCRNGWKNRVANIIPKEKHPEYIERIKYELGVINSVGLAGYFLIVQDYCNFAKKNGWLMSPARGSGGGCLVSFLTNISDVDPIRWGLSFERFYNAGRNSPGNISLPDIDCDFPTAYRDNVVYYVREKYGFDKVAQMATFARIQGRGALKEVLSAHGACSFDVMNTITECIPDESKIIEELQLMREEDPDGEASIIEWALENNAQKLAPFCKMDENGELTGEYSRYFNQAMRLEGTKKSRGRHAAGVVISMTPLADICPMAYDEGTGYNICDMEMGALEKLGIVKFDFLAISALDKLMLINELLEEE